MSILNKHEIIIKSANDYGHIIIIVIVIMIIAITLYNIYTNYMKTDHPIADIDLSVYVFDKYGRNFIDKNSNSNSKPIT